KFLLRHLNLIHQYLYFFLDPIIKIINGDQQNIGPALPHLLVGEQAGREAYKCKGEKVTFNHSFFCERILLG
ncbi:MAG: hypothetical protein ACO3UY_08960, partial [Opitutales bacterium]